ncbi:MAG TPA: PEP-CTERM sorting domain-containing protein [Fimbriimonadaceae bacterium]|nr:PEP-CTERM sorting domain-containing protein [Fimbriimonadaceae bacterium]
MPTDHFGNTSSGTAGGGPSYFTAWDSTVLGGSAQSFNASIDGDPNNDTTLNMDEQSVPLATGSQAGGNFTHDYLPSEVSQSDSLNLNFNMPSYSFSRPLITFNDGTSIVSPFAELASSGVWVVLGTASNNFQYIFQGPYGTSDPTAKMFNAGDPIENQVVGPWSNTDTVNFSGVAPGTYSVTYYAISWDTLGLPDNTLSGYTIGNFQQSDGGTITVAPEPAPVVALGLGLILLIRRHRKVRMLAPAQSL